MIKATLGFITVSALATTTTAQATFNSQQVITIVADGAQSVYATDLDGDGDADVLSASTQDDKIAWYENARTLPVTSTSMAYGVGCGNPASAFMSTANPVIGTTASALISNVPTSLTGVGMGWSDAILANLPILPVDLSTMGMSGCQLLQSNDVLGLSTATITASTAQLDLAIPFAPSLIGVHVYAQAYAFAPSANALQVIAATASTG